jgi:hypothetical protein
MHRIPVALDVLVRGGPCIATLIEPDGSSHPIRANGHRLEPALADDMFIANRG